MREVAFHVVRRETTAATSSVAADAPEYCGMLNTRAARRLRTRAPLRVLVGERRKASMRRGTCQISLRMGRKLVRTSSEKAAGCSQAAKCPPFSGLP